MAVRGGYGSVHVLPLLDAAEVRRARKAFVGYSDLTSLLTYLTGPCGLVAFHGPTVTGHLERGAEGYDRATLLGLLTRAEPLGELALPGLEAFRPVRRPVSWRAATSRCWPRRSGRPTPSTRRTAASCFSRT